MKRIPKELADEMVLNVLVNISQLENVNSEFAKNSIDIMNDSTDNSVITKILLGKARPSLYDENEDDMKATVLSSLQSIISFADREKEEGFGFNEDLAKEFSATDMNKCAKSTKLDFAVSQFVNAFYDYERLEKKYPELMKFM